MIDLDQRNVYVLLKDEDLIKIPYKKFPFWRLNVRKGHDGPQMCFV